MICARAADLQKEIPEHTCFKNWSGSANAMEADIIVDGFRQSMSMYGVKYTRVIGKPGNFRRLILLII